MKAIGRSCYLDCRNPATTTYFPFPTNEKIRKKWTDFCLIPDTVVNIEKCLCEHHFQESDILIIKGKKLLKSNAVPTKYLLKGSTVIKKVDKPSGNEKPAELRRLPDSLPQKVKKEIEELLKSDSSDIDEDSGEYSSEEDPLFDESDIDEYMDFTLKAKEVGPDFVQQMGASALELISAELSETRENMARLDKKHSKLHDAITKKQNEIADLKLMLMKEIKPEPSP